MIAVVLSIAAGVVSFVLFWQIGRDTAAAWRGYRREMERAHRYALAVFDMAKLVPPERINEVVGILVRVDLLDRQLINPEARA